MIDPHPILPGDSDLKAALKRSLNERARDQAFHEGRRSLVSVCQWAAAGFAGSTVVWAERLPCPHEAQ